MKNKLRKLTIANETYLWRRGHMHLAEAEYVHSPCVEVVIVYLEGYKNSPLHLYFKEDDNLTPNPAVGEQKWCVGSDDEGIIWLFANTGRPSLPNNAPYPPEERQSVRINLNRPAVITEIIKYYTQTAWQPKAGKTPTLVEHGLKVLEILDLPQGDK